MLSYLQVKKKYTVCVFLNPVSIENSRNKRSNSAGFPTRIIYIRNNLHISLHLYSFFAKLGRFLVKYSVMTALSLVSHQILPEALKNYKHALFHTVIQESTHTVTSMEFFDNSETMTFRKYVLPKETAVLEISQLNTKLRL